MGEKLEPDIMQIKKTKMIGARLLKRAGKKASLHTCKRLEYL